jgi:very-short-patch-repair endonuclease
VPPAPRVPRRLRYEPFRGSAAVSAGLLSKRQLAGPEWRRLYPDVYLHREALLDHFAWCDAAALLLPPGAAIGGRSAACLFFADLLPRGESPVEVVLPVARTLRRHPMLSICRSALGRADLTRMGIRPVTSPIRTAFDIARRPGLPDAVAGVDALLTKGLLTVADLARYADEHAGWPGSRQVRRVLELAVSGAESPMETRLRLLLVLAGLPAPAVQYDVPAARARLDLAYSRLKLGIEYDGDHHRERHQFQRDVARLNRLRLLGWTVLRFTADDVLRHPDRVVDQVRRALCPDLLGYRAALGQ